MRCIASLSSIPAKHSPHPPSVPYAALEELPRFIVPMMVSAGPAIEADWALEVKSGRHARGSQNGWFPRRASNGKLMPLRAIAMPRSGNRTRLLIYVTSG